MPSFPWRRYVFFLVLIVLIGVFPVISVVVSSAIAEANGCVLHEGSANPCIVFGADWGDTLYTMFVMGWALLFTIPASTVLLGIWVLALLVQWVRWKSDR